MDGIEFLNFLGLDVESFIVSVMALAILLAIVFLVRVFRIEALYKRYESQFNIIERYAPDVFLRLAFPSITDDELEVALLHYAEVADERVVNGLSYIDPRMLYAIDRVEEALPESYQFDFNIILDKMEVIYVKMKNEGAFVLADDNKG
jgi:hypothetical protein